MDKHKTCLKKILDLTLEIIYVLTGEDYTLVKKTSCSEQHTINVAPSHFSIPESNTNEKIMEVIHRILQLLTKEKNIEESKDLYKGENAKLHQIFPSPDGSRKRNPPQRCPRPQYSRESTKENPPIPHHDQVHELVAVKDESKEEEDDLCLKHGQHFTDDVKSRVKEEGSFLEPTEETSGEHINGDLEDNVPCQGENPMVQTNLGHHSEDSLQDLPNSEEPFPHAADTVAPSTLPGLPIMDKSPDPSKLEEASDNNSHGDIQVVQPQVQSEAESPAASKPKEPPSESSGTAPGPPCITRPLDGSIPDEEPICKSEKDETDECLTRTSNITKDLKLCTDFSSFVCPECGKCFEKQKELDHHQRTHTETMPYSCSDCGKRFPVKSKLVQHVRIHTGEKPFRCTMCGKCYTTKTNLTAHQSIHTAEKPFPCSKCGKCFSRKASLLTHLRIHNGDKDFTCGECGKSFTLKCYLRIHEKIHTGEKPFACSECGKCFLQRSAFVKHQRLHKGDKPFSCQECGKCFLEKGQLAIHQRIHTGERPFACSECYKSFIKKSDLQRHQRTHTGEKPFSCSQCGKCFTQKSHLVAHQRVHTGEKIPSCSECGRCPRKFHSGQHHEGHTH